MLRWRSSGTDCDIVGTSQTLYAICDIAILITKDIAQQKKKLVETYPGVIPLPASVYKVCEAKAPAAKGAEAKAPAAKASEVKASPPEPKAAEPNASKVGEASEPKAGEAEAKTAEGDGTTAEGEDSKMGEANDDKPGEAEDAKVAEAEDSKMGEANDGTTGSAEDSMVAEANDSKMGEANDSTAASAEDSSMAEAIEPKSTEPKESSEVKAAEPNGSKEREADKATAPERNGTAGGMESEKPMAPAAGEPVVAEAVESKGPEPGEAAAPAGGDERTAATEEKEAVEDPPKASSRPPSTCACKSEIVSEVGCSAVSVTMSPVSCVGIVNALLFGALGRRTAMMTFECGCLGIFAGGWEPSATLLYRQGRVDEIQERFGEEWPGTSLNPCDAVGVLIVVVGRRYRAGSMRSSPRCRWRARGLG